ncbi:HAD family hydrolase [Haploplasma axanthum]|uniref:Phosphoglycolate phosphatase n=1 Tax=Haploplasma axanthum TaxID=29552 RepID=A0A449BDE7_HAPAX|nr:HAD family hydrolase [Haploplasma axanthum]VEU80469.1 Phosphoglycolate phosphatase [Haploplasma axanthum]
MIKGVIFDLDGTLLDSVTDIMNSLNKILGKYDYELKNYQEVRSYLGNGAQKLVERSIPSEKDREVLNRIVSEYNDYYKKNSNIDTKPYDGIMELLEYLKNHNYKTAITSNKIQEGVTSLNNDTFKGLIDVAIGERVGLKLKPNPDMIYLALKELNLNADEVLYVGDTEVDLLTAQNAKLKSIAVTWGFRDYEVLADLNPNYIVNEPKEIINILKEV